LPYPNKKQRSLHLAVNPPTTPQPTHPPKNTQPLQVVRTPDQIRAGMSADEGAGGVDRDDPNLVAYWKFDEGKGYSVRVGCWWRCGGVGVGWRFGWGWVAACCLSSRI